MTKAAFDPPTPPVSGPWRIELPDGGTYPVLVDVPAGKHTGVICYVRLGLNSTHSGRWMPTETEALQDLAAALVRGGYRVWFLAPGERSRAEMVDDASWACEGVDGE